MGEQMTVNNMLRQVEVRLKLVDGPPIYGDRAINSPSDAIFFMRDFLKEMDREYFCVVNIDSKGKPLGFCTVSMGDINSSLIPIQNVFKTGILQNASMIMCFHNHPSGDVTPSKEDIIVTRRLSAVGNLLNIQVCDHIIVGGLNGNYYSFKENSPQSLDQVVSLVETDNISSYEMVAENNALHKEDTTSASIRRHR